MPQPFTVQTAIGSAVDAFFRARGAAGQRQMALLATLTLEDENAAHWGEYAFPMADPDGVGLFELARPALPAGEYFVFYRQRADPAQPAALVTDFGLGAEAWNSPGAIPPGAPSGGWPTADDVIAKLAITAPDGLSSAYTDDLPLVLAAVIAEFQSPAGPDGSGGTGRIFTPTPDTRFYDGNGYPELHVDDLVPGAALSVAAFGTELPDVTLKTAYHGLGSNILILPQGGFAAYAYPRGVFPLGEQNIAVTGTFGYAATVPQDVFEAIRCEAAHRVLIQAAVPLDGIGQIVTIGNFTVNTSSGVSVWAQSSPIAKFHEVYQQCVLRYRDRGSWRRTRLVPRMS